MVGLAVSFWLTLGWTDGYDPGTSIFWLGPIGIVFAD